MPKRDSAGGGSGVKGPARAHGQACLACGTTALVTASLFPGGDDRWECPRCATWGTIATKDGRILMLPGTTTED
jgi:hypothetical protein